MSQIRTLEALIYELFSLKPILPGVINERLKKCGRKGCRCGDTKNPKKHLCYQLSYKTLEERSTLHIKKSELETVIEMSESYKKLRNILKQFSAMSIQIVKEFGVQESAKIIQLSIVSAKSKFCTGKPESGKLRDTKISRDKWKEKSLHYKSELNKNKVTIRDLTISRQKWRDEAMEARKAEEAYKKEINDQQEKINVLEKELKNTGVKKN